MNAPLPSLAVDRRDMLSRVLACCPDIENNESVMRHLFSLGMTVSEFGASEFDAALDEARAQRRRDPFCLLGTAAASVVSRINRFH